MIVGENLWPPQQMPTDKSHGMAGVYSVLSRVALYFSISGLEKGSGNGVEVLYLLFYEYEKKTP